MTNYTQWKSLVDLHEYSALPDDGILYDQGSNQDDWQIGLAEADSTHIKNEDNLFAETSNEDGNSRATWTYENLIDWSPFVDLTIDWRHVEKEDGLGIFGFSAEIGSGYDTDTETFESGLTNTRQEITYDITDINESLFLNIGARDNGTQGINASDVEIYKVQVE